MNARILLEELMELVLDGENEILNLKEVEEKATLLDKEIFKMGKAINSALNILKACD
jgi:hypothetical protein